MPGSKEYEPYFARVKPDTKMKIRVLKSQFGYRSQQALLILCAKCLQAVLEGTPLPALPLEASHSNSKPADPKEQQA